MKPFVYNLLQLIILFAAVLTILDGGTIGVSASTTTVLHFQGNSEDIGPNGNEIAMDSRRRIIGVYSDGCNFDHPCINITDKSASKAQNQGSACLTIIRQRSGMRLFGASIRGIRPERSGGSDAAAGFRRTAGGRLSSRLGNAR